MTALLPHDYDQLLQVVRELQEPCTLADFPHRVMALVPRLVRSERTAYNEVNLGQSRIVGWIDPDEPSAEEIGAWLQPHLSTHPVITHVERTGDLAPRAISDFWSRSRYHRSAIYNECYRWIGVEDQLALPFGPQRQVKLAVTLNRSRRSFSERDRSVLELLRPHLTQAYLSAAQFSLLQSEIARRGALLEAMDCGAMLMRPDGSIVFCSDKAALWLRFYFGPQALQGLQAPAPLRAWLGACQDDPPGATPLCIARGQASLFVRLTRETPDGLLLSLEERAAPPPLSDALRALQSLGLTPRQSEVLWLLSQGESNAQIAAYLTLSPHTTKRHLEAIFNRLCVQNRSAAAFCAQQALRSGDFGLFETSK